MGDAGFCTWGAMDLWKRTVGYYPDVRGPNGRIGNAILWDNSDHAAAHGWRVSTIPTKRAFVVFDTGTFGHVGWVTGISKNSSGQVIIAFTDMNGGSFVDPAAGITTDFDKFVNRTRVWDPDTQRFILASL